MVTVDKAEDLSQKFLQDYIEQCHCANAEDVYKVTLKMLSMCVSSLCAMTGVASVQKTIYKIAHLMRAPNSPYKNASVEFVDRDG